MVGAPSKKCTHLLAGASAGPAKLKQAKKFKMTIWGEDELKHQVLVAGEQKVENIPDPNTKLKSANI